MECVKSADILKPAKSAAKGLMAVISGDEGGSGYVGQVIRRTAWCADVIARILISECNDLSNHLPMGGLLPWSYMYRR